MGAGGAVTLAGCRGRGCGRTRGTRGGEEGEGTTSDESALSFVDDRLLTLSGAWAAPAHAVGPGQLVQLFPLARRAASGSSDAPLAAGSGAFLALRGLGGRRARRAGCRRGRTRADQAAAERARGLRGEGERTRGGGRGELGVREGRSTAWCGAALLELDPARRSRPTTGADAGSGSVAVLGEIGRSKCAARIGSEGEEGRLAGGRRFLRGDDSARRLDSSWDEQRGGRGRSRRGRRRCSGSRSGLLVPSRRGRCTPTCSASRRARRSNRAKDHSSLRLRLRCPSHGPARHRRRRRRRLETRSATPSCPATPRTGSFPLVPLPSTRGSGTVSRVCTSLSCAATEPAGRLSSPSQEGPLAPCPCFPPLCTPSCAFLKLRCRATHA